MFLSEATYQSFQVTANSLPECVEYLLSNGFHYVLTAKFTQDPLRNILADTGVWPGDQLTHIFIHLFTKKTKIKIWVKHCHKYNTKRQHQRIEATFRWYYSNN